MEINIIRIILIIFGISFSLQPVFFYNISEELFQLKLRILWDFAGGKFFWDMKARDAMDFFAENNLPCRKV